MTTTEFQVTGMSCTHCERAIRSEVGGVAGVTDVTVSASDGILRVQTEGRADAAAIVAAVDEAGYSAVAR